jgi:ATP-dependent Lon protease
MTDDNNDEQGEANEGGAQVLPLLPLRDIVIFPESLTPLFVGRPRSVAALETAMKSTAPGTERRIVLSAQRAARTEEPGPDDVFTVCTIGVVKTLLLLQNNMMKVLVSGEQRARIKRFAEPGDLKGGLPEGLGTEPFVVEVEPLPSTDESIEEGERETLLTNLQQAFEDYARLSKRVQMEVPRQVAEIDDPTRRADVIAGYVPLKPADKQQLLEELDVKKRVVRLTELIEAESEVVRMQRKVRGRFKKPGEMRQASQQSQAQSDAEDLQDEFKNELNDLEERLKRKPLTDEARDRVARELKKLRMMSMMSAEATVVRGYLDWVATLPWKHYSKDPIDIATAEEILDEDHFGLEKVKERILEHLAVQKLVDRMRGPILCLVGPPGVGKSSLARSVARATGRDFVRLSLGGVRDEAEIRGHRRTYIGALPGKIISSFKRAGTSNPVLLLDEIDKMSTDFRGDPAAALLEVLDPEQNNAFVDHYLDLDYDLSRVLFICTANGLSGIAGPLQDRLEIIELSGYTDLEKLSIARNYLVPKQLEANGLAEFAPIEERDDEGMRKQLKGAQVSFDDKGLRKIIDNYTREAGVRSLEREIGTCCRKAAIELLKRVGEPDAEALAAEAARLSASEASSSPPPEAEDAKEDEPTQETEPPIEPDNRDAADDDEGEGEGEAEKRRPPPLPGKAARGKAKGTAAEDPEDEGKRKAVEAEKPDMKKAALRNRLEGEKLKLTSKKVQKYLGTERYRRRDTEEKDLVGVTNGLSWSRVGGAVLLTEVALTPGRGKLRLTGSLGDVMQESGHAAMTYVRSHAAQLGLSPDFYDRIDVHIHFPEGATPKDGPSAGVTVATSLVSALTKIPVRRDVAMTGEITLRGRVTAIGGLKEKALAAYRAGCSVVIIPRDNEKDLADIPTTVKKKLKFIPVESVDEVLRHALAVEDPEAFFGRLQDQEPSHVFDALPARASDEEEQPPGVH